MPRHEFTFNGYTIEFANGRYFEKVMTYAAGSSFGDLALTNPTNTRAATVKAEEQCVIGSLEQLYYNKCLQKLH